MLRALLHGSVTRLLRLAAVFALIGLGVMCFAILSGRALPVIFAMSVGHLIGVLAVGCYVLAVVIDGRRRDVGVPASSPFASGAQPARRAASASLPPASDPLPPARNSDPD